MDGNIDNIIYYLPLEYDKCDIQKAFSDFIDDVIYCVDSAMSKDELIEELTNAKTL